MFDYVQLLFLLYKNHTSHIYAFCMMSFRPSMTFPCSLDYWGISISTVLSFFISRGAMGVSLNIRSVVPKHKKLVKSKKKEKKK